VFTKSQLTLLVFFLSFYVNIGFLGAENNKSNKVKNINGSYHPLHLQTNYLFEKSRGVIFFMTSYEYKHAWITPLTKLKGNLNRFGLIRFDYFLADKIYLQVHGAIWEVLENSSSVQDVGDFTVSTVATLIEQKKNRPAIGIQIESKLPNTNQNKGLGPNTIDVSFSLLLKQARKRFTTFYEIGVGILAAPGKLNLQNDVLIYGFGFSCFLNRHISLCSEVYGSISTVKKAPVGTESRNRIQFGLVYKFEHLALELFPSYGLNRREGNLGIGVGISLQFNILTKYFKD
jgi:hypothetical protein